MALLHVSQPQPLPSLLASCIPQEQSTNVCSMDKQPWTRKNIPSSQIVKKGATTQRCPNGNDLWVDADVIVPPCNLAFVYGTLKKGFANHWLMEELMSSGHARYVGSACTKHRFPLVCGPFRVPFLLHIPASGHHVHGEVYQIDETAHVKLDELEGVNKGHYVRRPVVITDLQVHPGVLGDPFDYMFLNTVTLRAEAYFAASDFTPGMSRALYIDCYSRKEASAYVRRKDRPQNCTFLEHVHAWIKDQESAEYKQD